MNDVIKYLMVYEGLSYIEARARFIEFVSLVHSQDCTYQEVTTHAIQ